MGRDIFSMIWYGGRESLIIGILSVVIITVIGVTYGCISGMVGNRLDALMMRAVELANSIPSLLLVLLLVSIMGKQDALKMSFIIGITGWFGLARITRSEIRQIRNSEYVLASKSSGARFGYLMIHHLVPNLVAAIMFIIISSISTSMSMESTMSFLGLGLPVEVVSWGSMLSLANKALLLNTWWVIVIPGAFLVVTLLCITNIGNYFRKETNRKESVL
jgi:peptide/nickel transport system permease protein